MDSAAIGDLLQLALRLTFEISAPMLFAGLVIGVLVSIVQAATQVNEVTLVFIPKMIGVGATMWLLGPWLVEELMLLVNEVAHQISMVATP